MIIKSEVKVVADVEIDEEIIKNAREQYGESMTEENIAANVLRNLTTEGIFKANITDVYWDGVAKLNNNIINWEVDFKE